MELSGNLQHVELALLTGETYSLAWKENAWQADLPLPEGFQYVTLKTDGAEVLTPWLPIGFGAARPINFIEVPAADDSFYQPGNEPHGSVVRDYFSSSVTGNLESCLIYLPPQYDAHQKYPVLYLQHGLGENETSWLHQGRMNYILDHLIAEHKSVPMIVVMCSGMVQIKGQYNYEIFPDYLVQDVIPFIESKYPILSDKWHRAMAGLSMGSMHTSVAVLTYPDLFGYAGLFSGFMRLVWKDEQPHLRILDDPKHFSESYRVFFRAMGRDDGFFNEFLQDDEIIRTKNIFSIDRRVYEGKHEWQVWRHCLYDFLPMLFQS